MAYVNVEEWSSDEVSNWMKGLEPCLSAYVNQLWEAGVSGKQLLQLAPDLLPRLGIHKIGHQELLLQAVAQLRNIHYQLDKETLQQLALRLSSRARSVYNELRQQESSLDNGTSCNGREDDYKNSDDDENSRNDNNKKASQKKSRLVSTATVAAVADCLAAVKTVVSWLNRTPFNGLPKFDRRLEELTELGIRLATISQRDQFAENQAIAIMDNCNELSKIADDIIQNDRDPLIIQPASLVVATIKKKHDDDLGVHLITTYDGVHQVSIIRPLTPAHTCGKLSLGDQLIQVNYDTVIGWTPEKVMKALSENPVEVILTVKKQPRHAPGAQQIYSYFKPFRLPSKKRSYNHGYAGQHEYSYRNNFSNNLNIYSFLDQSAGSRQIFSTLPKSPPLASPDQPLQASGASLRPVSPERSAAPTLGVGSSGGSREGRQSSVSFAVSEAPSNSDTGSSFGVSVPSPSPSGRVHNASDSCIRLRLEDDDDDDDPFLSSDDDLTAHQDGEDDAASTSGASVRLYPPKPRAPVHRRATIPGDTAPPLTAATTLNQYIEGLRQSGLVLRVGGRVSTGDERNPVIRSTAGQETRSRPHTIAAAKLLRDGSGSDQVSQTDTAEDRFVSGQARVGPVSLPAKVSSTASIVDREAAATRPQLSLKGVPSGDDSATMGSSPPTVHDMPLPFTITSPPTPLTPNPPSTPHTPGGRRVSEDRPRLDKSHSTPAYDFGSEGAPNSTTSVSGPSSTALLVPGSAPAAAMGGHRNLLLPGAEPHSKVQAGVAQKKHLPAPGETKKVKIGSAKLKQSTFYCDDVESPVGDSVFYVGRTDSHVRLASSPSITLESSPGVTELSNYPVKDKILTLPDKEAQPPTQTITDKKLVVLESTDLSGAIGKTTPLRERRTARLQPLTNLTIDQEHLSIPVHTEDAKNAACNPAVESDQSGSSKQQSSGEAIISGVCSASQESAKASETSVLYLPVLEQSSSASPSKPLSVTQTNENTCEDSGKSLSPLDQGQFLSLKSGSIVKRPSSWTESMSGDLGGLEEPVTILSASPRDYSTRDDYKVFSLESESSSVVPNSFVPTENPGDRELRVHGTTVARDVTHPDNGNVPPGQNSLQMEIESTLRKNLEVSSSQCTSSDELWSDSASQTLSVGAQIGSGRRPGVCGGGRGISCRELGAGDHQGWLYRRAKGSRHFLAQNAWERRWFILKKGYLYGYSGEDALKAESLIYLPGFHVCPAQDAKTKKFAFKIYHANGATFYFACDTSEERSRWMSEMGLSALSSGRCGGDASGPSSPAAVAPTAAISPTSSSSSCSSPTLLPHHLEEAYYSETDDELDDSSLSTSAFPSAEEGAAHDASIAATAAAVSFSTAAPLVTTSTSSSAFSSLFHWSSSGKSSAAATVGTSSAVTSANSSRTSALSSFLKPKQIQAVPSANFRSYRRVREPGRSTSTSDLRQPALCEAPPLTPTTPKPVSQHPAVTKANAVARKGSLKEKLRSHLPSALTLDRRRKAPDSVQGKRKGKMDSKTLPAEVSRDKSDSTLSSSSHEKILEESANMVNASELLTQLGEESSVSLGRAQVSVESSGQTESNEAEFDSSVSCEDKGSTPRSSSSVLNDSNKMQPMTPLKCKLIDASLKGSLDCLSSTASPYGAHYRTATDGSQKTWISTLRSPSTQQGECITGPFKIKNRPSPLPRHHSSSGASSHFSSNPNSPKSPSTDGFGFSTSLTDTGGSSCSLSHTSSLIEHRSSGEQRPSSVERLKRAGNYKPVILKSKEPMRTAFVMGLDNDTETSPQGKHSALTSTPNSSQFSSSTLGSSVRPQVPPRTKFLSPSERITQRRSDTSLGLNSSVSLSRDDSRYNTVLNPSNANASSILESSLSPISAYKNPVTAANSSTLENKPIGGLSCRLELGQSPADDQEQPKTPLKYSTSLPSARRPPHVAKARPTMGVCMIGKQRRTPGVLSPREVFFCSPPPSPSAITSPALATSGSVSSSLSQHHYLPNTTLASTSHNPTALNPPSRPLSGGRQPASSTPVGQTGASQTGRQSAGSRPTGRPPSGSTSAGRHSKNQAEVASGGKAESSASDECIGVNRGVRVTSYTGPDGKPLMVLPHYPDMEYPPTFEAGSYTIPGFTESSSSCSHPPCTSHASSKPSNSSSPTGSSQQTSQNPRSRPYTPSYTPRTPRSPTLYYNLQGFNSASLPTLPSQDTEPPSNTTQRPHQSSSKLYSGEVSSASSLPPASLPLSQRPQMPLPHSGGSSLSATGGLSLHIPPQPHPSPQVSPHSSGSPRVIVGISCSGSDCVVSHHHSIYVTSPVKPNTVSRSQGDSSSCAVAGTPAYSETLQSERVQLSAVISPTSNREPVPKQSRRRTPPGSFTSQSNSSLDSISEHTPIQRSGNAAIRLPGTSSSSRSGGSATVLDPLKKSDCDEATREGINVGSFQFGGSSGGTVITTPGSGGHYSRSICSPKTPETQGQSDILRSSNKDFIDTSTPSDFCGRPKLDPPRLVLPGPPSDPPPDD
ncbi:CRIC domain [Trinorchestia longiramus]|nr:CRIC domain [Trinorchestia longiramus]